MIDDKEFWAQVAVYGDLLCMQKGKPTLRVWGFPDKTTVQLVWSGIDRITLEDQPDVVAGIAALQRHIVEGITRAKEAMRWLLQLGDQIPRHEDFSELHPESVPWENVPCWWAYGDGYRATAFTTENLDRVPTHRTREEAVEAAICRARDAHLHEYAKAKEAAEESEEGKRAWRLLRDSVAPAEGEWCFSDNEEWYRAWDLYPSREAAIEAAREELDPDSPCWVARKRPYTVSEFVDAAWIEDTLVERIADETMCFEHLTYADVFVEFDEATRATIDAFLDGFSNHIKVWGVQDEEQVNLAEGSTDG